MKKLKLTVAEPCYENWNDMTPDQKGRFCAACQKTVVDFTHMSDRQIRDYFKKPAGSVCGRFYNDQLNREMDVPDKKITLPKHFFRYTWPALLLMLKSCDERDESVEIMGVALEQTTVEMPPMMGNVLPQITPVDSKAEVTGSGKFCAPVLKGEVEVVQPENVILSVTDVDKSKMEAQTDTSFVQIDSAEIDLDSLKIADYLPKQEIITMGAVAVTQISEIKEQHKENTDKLPIQKTEHFPLVIFPNPVMQGQSLNVVLKGPLKGVYRIIASSGQVIYTGRLTSEKGHRFSIPVQGWSAGSYFILFADEKAGKTVTQKFIVQ